MPLALVTGAGGYVGNRLIDRLLASSDDWTVIAVDVRFSKPTQLPPGKVSRVQLDIRDADKLNNVFRDANVDVVFHIASFGMSGPWQLRANVVESINVGGTQNLLNACLAFNVQRFIYVSTYNVVFNGCRIVRGTESLPIVPPSEHVDPYSRTKAAAETLVLAANGSVTERGLKLKTVSIRPAAIYGDGEERHLPRIIRVINSGIGCFAIGRPDDLVDWVYVDNLVHALTLASDKLRTCTDVSAPPCGRPYFISDDYPVNNFVWVERMLGQRGLYLFHIPSTVMYGFALASEAFYKAAFLLGVPPSFEVDLALTRAEVCKVAYTHYMDLGNAKRELGYRPVITAEAAVERTAAWCRPQINSLQSRIAAAMLRLLAVILFCCALLYFVTVALN